MNWQERIDAARERGHFINEDKCAAAKWGTCAVSELVGIERVAGWNDPKDSELERLGRLFYCAVAVDAVDEAAETYAAIHRRYDELILSAVEVYAPECTEVTV